MTDSTKAELAITGARVWTGADVESDAVAIRGDRIAALGADAVAELIGPNTEVVDASGGMVVPGFQDAHCHAPQAGNNMLRVWLNDDPDDKDAYLRHIAQYAADHRAEPWIVGGGWAMAAFPGGTPRKEDLDAIVPDRPVFLFNRDVHGAWANSKALEIAGITKDSPDPADGRIERDETTGEPTGTLHEGAAYSFNDRYVPLPDDRSWRDAILHAQKHLHALGITGWQDAWVTPATLAAYRALAESGELTARVVGALWWDRHSGLEQLAQFLQQREQGIGRFFPTTVKIMSDGVLENFTGALLEPYCDGCGGRTDNTGLTYVEQELLCAAVTMLDEHGFQVHMHAIGDRAIRNCLDAVASARRSNGSNDLRHHIAHLQVIDPADLPRFAELGVVANCQAFWAQRDAQMDKLTIPFLGEERARLQYLFKSLYDSGARLAMGSDWAVSTANPLEQIEVAVTRVGPDDREHDPFLPEQALALVTALSAFTAGSAFVNHDDDAGVLAVGKRADLAVLDHDLFGTRQVLPADAQVTLTVASGQVVYRGEDGVG